MRNIIKFCLCCFSIVTLTCTPDGSNGNPAEQSKSRQNSSPFAEAREKMVQTQIIRRGIQDSLVLKAMRTVPRHLFVPESWRSQAYADSPQPIGHRQTISQPLIVAFMTEQLQLQGSEKVLEIGTGSGYQAAILGEIVSEVFSIEIVEPLAKRAAKILRELGYKNITVRHGDGYRGWIEQAPFDAIIITAAPNHIPQPLVKQLKPGGRMILPVGDFNQNLILITKTTTGEVRHKRVLPVRFVPMTGEAEK